MPAHTASASHVYPDSTERIIQYASQTLNETQQKYAHIDKEAYAIIFGVEKFTEYVFANKLHYIMTIKL